MGVCPGDGTKSKTRAGPRITGYREGEERGTRFFAAGPVLSEEEIENDHNRSEKEEQGSPAQAATRNTTQRADQMGRGGPEAGLFAGTVKRSEGLVAGEVSAKRNGFVVQPDEDVVAPAPDDDGADHEGQITEQSQQAQRRNRTPMHGASQISLSQ